MPQHRLERVAAQLGEVLGPSHQGVQLVRVPAPLGRRGYDLLCQHVQRIARHDRRLDRAVVHGPGDDGALEQVAAVLGEDHALRRLADMVAGPTDALEPPRDRPRRLHLDDQVDGAHVDAQFEACRGHEAAQPAVLQRLLDLQPLLARERAVVRLTSSSPASSLSCARQPLGEPARVDEHDRAAVRTDELAGSAGCTGGQMLAARIRRRRPVRRLLVGRQDLAHGGHVLHRHDDLEFERLADAGVDDRHRPGPASPSAGPAAEEAGDRSAAVAWPTARCAAAAGP